MAHNYDRAHLIYGQENVQHFTAASAWEAYREAREAAKVYAGVTGRTVPYLQELGPFRNRITGSQTPDGQRGWRIDLSQPAGALHVNWWDHTKDPDRRNKALLLYGANYVSGAGEQMFWEILSHFPPT